MRHKKTFNHLGRKSAHRKAMLANMAASLIKHKRIETTTAKAKALKRYIEPLITRSRDDSTHSRRVVFSYLQDKDAVTELFREVSAKVGERPGGYTRIIKLGSRLGDNADMCLIELVDYNENLLAEKAASKKSAGRRRRGSKKKTKDEVTAAAEVEVAESPEAVEEAEAPEAVADAVEETTTEEVAEEEAKAEGAEEAVEEVATEEVVAEEVVEEEVVAEEVVEEATKAEDTAVTETEAKAESEEEKKEEAGEHEEDDEEKKA